MDATAYDQCCRVEQSGLPRVLAWLEAQSDGGRLVLTNKGPLSQFLQETVGDAVVQAQGSAWGCEFKVEQRWTGNLFLETWSNRKWFRLGWLFTLQTDALLYYFEDTKTLVSVPFMRLKRWAFEGDNGTGNVYAYRERKQAKYDQRNDTWGRCVPVEVIVAATEAKVHKLGT